MIVELSLRSLLRRRSRTALAVAGIAVSAALLIDMTMLASGLTRSFAELTRSRGYSVRVTPRGTLPFDSEAGIRGAAEVRGRLAELPGVRDVSPILGARLYPTLGDSLLDPVFASGIDRSSQMVYVLVDGDDPEAGEVVVSGPFAESYGVGPGSEVQLAAEIDIALGSPRFSETFRVSGIGDFLFDYAGERSVAVPIEDVQRLTDRPDEASLFALALEPDQNEEAIAEEIQTLFTDLSAYSTGELMSAVDQRLLYFRQLSTILGSIALGVAALLVGTIVTIGVRERFGEIATLRAIGIPAARLQSAIIAEGVVLTSAGCLLGAPLGWLMAGRLDRILLGFPGIPARVSFFVFEPVSAAVAIGVVVLIGALVGVLPGTRALRTPLGQALREEAD